ncbi:hypothetical protein PR048_032944 [Dryococelus australis]|uniref:Peptidase aspartic putative domain-containing protein n=1 Tax=Dryococelus australis TaxID=614101 RepID=A0ABQ9G3N9_9NEOP|nr:hypothetical protein PR048_032944 [Dryococelus australis]
MTMDTTFWRKKQGILRAIITKTMNDATAATSDALLDFLKKEIETEQCVKLAHLLHSSTSTKCIFCDISVHKSGDYRKFAKVSTEEKRATLLRKGACYVCTELHHRAADCLMTSISISNRNGTIELLVGADIFGTILMGRRQKIEEKPITIETEFGWTVMGEMRGPSLNNTSYMNHVTRPKTK